MDRKKLFTQDNSIVVLILVHIEDDSTIAKKGVLAASCPNRLIGENLLGYDRKAAHQCDILPY